MSKYPDVTVPGVDAWAKAAAKAAPDGDVAKLNWQTPEVPRQPEGRTEGPFSRLRPGHPSRL
ncbi:MAG: hypothetical protein HZC24_10235 [Rhodocyclales bacterium]|nr:hypothetical protein [Rhodocyclales bacterium]